MEKRIILTSLFVALIFSSFIIYSSFAQTTNLPICITPEKYLAWPNFVKYNVPVASTTPGFLTVSPIYVSSTNIGIGTNNPSEKLYVAGGNIGLDVVNGGGIKIGTQARFGVDNTNQATIRIGTGGLRILNNAQNYVLATIQDGNYSNALFINSSGNVGIGTNNPQAKLHVAGGILSTGNYAFQTGSDTWRGGLYGYGTSSVTIFGLTQQGIRVDLYSISPWQHLGRGDIYVRNVNASNDVIANRFCIGTNCITQWPSQVAQYWTLSGNNLYTSSTNWNVGIGTNNPQAKLDIYATQQGPGGWFKGLHFSRPEHSAITLTHPNNGGLLLGLHGINQAFYFGRYNPDGSFDRYTMVINVGSGTVGIGTNNPSEILHVEGTIRTRGLRLGNVDTTNKYDYIRIFSDQGGGYIGGLMYSSSSSYGINSFTIYSTNNRNIILYPGSGNVGIGTNNPQAKLHVVGDILSSNKVTANQFCIGTNCINQWPSQVAQYWTLSGNNLYTSSTNWNVGIGTTAPQYKLQVVSGSGRWTAINADGSIVVNRDGAPPYILFQGSGGGISYIYNPSEGTGGRAMAFYTQADGQNYSEKVRITGAGNVGIGTTNPQAKLEVAGAIRLTPQTATPTPIAGTMYFDQNSGVFKCYQKTGVDQNNNPIYGWVDCAGQGGRPSEGLVIPVVIKDSAGNVVLEINQE
jgi:hypothetical protein